MTESVSGWTILNGCHLNFGHFKANQIENLNISNQIFNANKSPWGPSYSDQ